NEKDFSVVMNITSEMTPQTGPIGTEVTISGEGFTAGSTVTITYDGSQIETTTVAADRSFSAAFTVPTGSGGEKYTVVASDGTNTEQHTFTVESTPPAIPVPLKPEMNLNAQAETYFDWQDVTDPSLPVIYSLQVATSGDFSASSIVLQQPELEQSEYTLARENRLPSVSQEAPYYWRVKAIDGAGNESEWSGTGAFYIGTSLSVSQPLIYTLIGVGAVVLAGLAFWMGRKTAYY
ncbi:IPT/TIG domain-containing protein, partial [Chloroflexota bacterium]